MSETEYDNPPVSAFTATIAPILRDLEPLMIRLRNAHAVYGKEMEPAAEIVMAMLGLNLMPYRGQGNVGPATTGPETATTEHEASNLS